jgi:signal peptidase
MNTSSRPRPARLLRLLLALAMTTVRVALGCAMVAVTVGLMMLTVLPHLGARGLIVTSGSMEPVIGTGDLAIVRSVDPEVIRPGDVITYAGYTSFGLTTHRVLRPVDVDGRLHFQTQGDANDTPDPDLAPAEGVLGRVALTVPHGGRALALLEDPAARLLILGLPAAWLTVHYTATILAELRRSRRGVAPRHASAAAVALLLGTGVLAHSIAFNSSAAVLTDTVAVGENTFTTGTWTV